MVGAEDQDGIKPRSFAVKLNAMLCLVIVDCVLNAFPDVVWGAENEILIIVSCIASMAIHLAMMLVLFMLLWHTFLLRNGLLFEVWSEVYGTFIISFLRFGLLCGARLPRMIAALDYLPIGDYWDLPLHYWLYMAHNYATVPFHAWMLYRSHMLSRVRFYKPQLWHKRLVGRRRTNPAQSA
mmetsp:Transcript_79072/g.214081  ORF Transcript_79072/g.214081 Transcript_79072/m.214081 type:complete len:181 (-) Transcript_79072:285-827(-)